tara:strand:- start:9344 stop:10162 length:819 start_codon:yes stop_codon:yes gene_type:complete
MEKLQGIPNVLQYDIIEEKVEEVNEETGEENPNFIYTEDGRGGELKPKEEEELLEDEDIGLPEFVPKPKPNDEDIFEDNEIVKKPKPQISGREPAPSGRVNKNGQPRKKRKPMTDHQKELLGEARKKAFAKKKFLAQQRKGEKQVVNQNKAKKKQLLQEKEKLEVDDLEQEVEQKKKIVSQKKQMLEEPQVSDDDDEYIIPDPTHKKSQYITKKDLEQAQLATLIHYEQMRKARKAEKKKKQQEAEYLNQVATTIKKVNGWKEVAGPYSGFY